MFPKIVSHSVFISKINLLFISDVGVGKTNFIDTQ